MTLDHVFEKKSDIEEAVSIGLKTKINNYGYDIDGSPVTDIQPDEKVRAAMNEINAASRLREAAEQQGEAVRIKTVKSAEAEKESKKLQGEGIAAERIAIATGIRDSVAALLSVDGGVSPGEAMRTLILTQYFDTLRAIGAQSRATTVFLPHSPGGMADLSRQISEAIMVGNQAPGPAHDEHRSGGAAGSVPATTPARAA